MTGVYLNIYLYLHIYVNIMRLITRLCSRGAIIITGGAMMPHMAGVPFAVAYFLRCLNLSLALYFILKTLCQAWINLNLGVS